MAAVVTNNGGMVAHVAFVLGMVGVIVVVARIAQWSRVPEAVLLTLVGLATAVLPGPELHLEPEFVLAVVIPPLLYSTALRSSLLALRTRLRAVVSLSVLLVAATALAVGSMVSWLVPAVPLAAAIALGAAVAPPDPVAALAVGRTAGLPAKLSTLIEGEGLLNDATALTILQVAVAVAVGGQFSLGSAAGAFALATAGGLLVGWLVARVMRWLRRWFDDPLSSNALSLATPFLAYLAAEAVHGSGVLAVVVAGLILGHQNPRVQSGASRLQTTAVWRLVGFLLEGFVFLLIGQQLPEVLANLGSYPTSTVAEVAGITVATVLLLRPLWLVVTQYGPLPRVFRARLGGVPADPVAADPAAADAVAADPVAADPVAADPGEAGPGEAGPAPRDDRLSGAEITALSWAGTRGVITLAAAFALPMTVASGAPLPGRDLIVFAAYVVVLVTLLVQGVTFAPLLRRLRLESDDSEQTVLRSEAWVSTLQAGMTRLEQLIECGEVDPRVAESLRHNLTARLERDKTKLAILTEDPEAFRSPTYESAVQARREVLEAQRDELLRWREAGWLPDSSMRVLQRDLDHEERLLPMPPAE